MQYTFGLIADSVNQSLVRIAKATDGNAPEKIPVFPALCVYQAGVVPVYKADGKPLAKYGHIVLLVQLFDFF